MITTFQETSLEPGALQAIGQIYYKFFLPFVHALSLFRALLLSTFTIPYTVGELSKLDFKLKFFLAGNLYFIGSSGGIVGSD